MTQHKKARGAITPAKAAGRNRGKGDGLTTSVSKEAALDSDTSKESPAKRKERLRRYFEETRADFMQTMAALAKH